MALVHTSLLVCGYTQSRPWRRDFEENFLFVPMQKNTKSQGRADLMQKNPLTIRRRISIRREVVNGFRNRKYDKIPTAFKKQYREAYTKSSKVYKADNAHLSVSFMRKYAVRI